MNKKIILSILLVLLVGSISAVMAVENGENVTYKGYGNGTYIFNDVDNNTVNGYCLNQTKSSPSVGSNMSVSNDTSSVDNRIKELIVTYYRGDESALQSNNVAIRTAIWNITNGQSTGANTSLASQMIANLTGISIGNTYTATDGIYNYIFNFYYGTSSSSNVQPMLLFTFLAELIPEEPPEEPEINETNETNETNVTNETPVVPVIPNNTTEDPIINETNNTVENNTTEIVSEDNNATITNGKFIEDDPVSANMKNTAMNWNYLILAIIIVLLVAGGYAYYSKK